MIQAKTVRMLLLLIWAVTGGVAPAQFVAFNDHYQGPKSNPNDTFWNIFGTTAARRAASARSATSPRAVRCR